MNPRGERIAYHRRSDRHGFRQMHSDNRCRRGLKACPAKVPHLSRNGINGYGGQKIVLIEAAAHARTCAGRIPRYNTTAAHARSAAPAILGIGRRANDPDDGVMYIMTMMRR